MDGERGWGRERGDGKQPSLVHPGFPSCIKLKHAKADVVELQVRLFSLLVFPSQWKISRQHVFNGECCRQRWGSP